MSLRYALFDFDGTIADTSEGIVKSVAYALERLGIHINGTEELYRFIGPPLYDSFVGFYGFSHEKALKAIELFRESYTTSGIYQSRMYDDMEALLCNICSRKTDALIVSSKPEKMIEILLDIYGIGKYFAFVAGAVGMDRRDKCSVMKYAVSTCGIATADAVMIGDTKYDIEAARLFGIRSIGVTYGFGSESELKAEGANYIAHSVKEAEKIILGLHNGIFDTTDN